MKRAEVWWAKMPEPAGRRPVVLVSRDAAYAVRASVPVVEISTTVRGIASEVKVLPRSDLRALVDQCPAPGRHTPIAQLPLEQSAAVWPGNAHLPYWVLQRCRPHWASLWQGRARGSGTARELVAVGVGVGAGAGPGVGG